MSTFNGLLADIPDALVKVSGIESPDEVQLENDFANMAFAFLRDRAAGLMPYLLGFEVVDREADGSKAVGIFGFKIDDDYYYVPAFFVGGQIKGMDLLFSTRTNSFVPLKETWINYIINKRAITLGDAAVDGNALQRDFESPDFGFIASPPNVKAGAADAINGGFDAWNVMQSSTADMLDKSAELQEAFACAIARMEHTGLPIEKRAGGVVQDWIKQNGGPAATEAMLTKLSEDVDYATSFFTFYPAVDAVIPEKYAADLKPEKSAAQLTVIHTDDMPSACCDDPSDSEKQRVVRDGFAIVDRRPDDSKAELLDDNYTTQFSSPDRTGEYNVLLRNGSIMKLWVFTDMFGLNGVAMVHPTKRLMTLADSRRVMAEGSGEGDADTPYGKAISRNRVSVGDVYIFVDDKGRSVVPLRISSVIAENGRRKRFKVHAVSYIDHTMSGSHRTTAPDISWVEFADHSGAPTLSGDKIILPANFKALKVYDSPWRADDEKSLRVLRDIMVPGDSTDMQEFLFKSGCHNLTVENDGVSSEYYIRLDDFNDGPYGYKTAAVRLAKDYHIDADQVDALLKAAASDYKVHMMIKFAQSVMMPSPQMPPMGYEDFTGQPIEYANQQLVQGQSVGMPQPLSTMDAQRISGGQSQLDASGSGAPADLDNEAMQLAQQAAQAGQKQVFDHATIGGLAGLYDTSATIDSYVPELSKALDRIGRILFIFYWKNEEFSERYGSDDMHEMEDLIRSVFKSFGDLLLKLKQKSVDTDMQQ